MWRLACCLIVAGCGRVGFDARDATSANDASADAMITPHTPFAIELAAPSALRGIAMMPDGSVAVVGYVGSDTMFGTIPVTVVGGADIVLAVVESTGVVRWAKTFGSSGEDDAWDVVAAADGTLFITGQIAGPTSFGGSLLVPSVQDVFVASFTAAGAHRWSKRFAGAGAGPIPTQVGFHLALLSGGDVIVTGRIAGNVDYGDGVTTSGPAVSAMVAGLRGTNGTTLWAVTAVNSSWSTGFGVGTDALDRVYVAGEYSGTPDFGGGPLVNRGGDDAFIGAGEGSGSYLGEDTFGGTGDDWAFGVATLGDTLYVSGFYNGSTDWMLPPSQGLTDAFVVTYTISTPSRAWARAFGAAECDHVAVLEAESGELLLGGSHSGTIDLGTGPHTAVDASDALFAALAPDGTTLASMSFGGVGDDIVTGIAGSRANGAYLVGQLGTDLVRPGCAEYPLGGVGFVRRL